MISTLFRYLLGTILIIAAFFNFSCRFGEVHSVTTIGEMTLGVDENEYSVLKKETDEFMRMNKEAKVDIKVKTTNELFADFLNGDIKTIIVDREFTPQETDYLSKFKIEVKKYKFALNGIGVIVNPDNPVKKLNFNELSKIYTGDITDWKDMEGDNKDVYKGKIKPFIARKNSAMHEMFKSKVLLNKDFYKSDVICSTSTQMLDEIRNNKYSIGFISMSWLTKFADTLDTVVKPLKIASVDSTGIIGEYVSLHQAYIAEKTYPLIFYVYVYSRDFEMNLSVGYTSFLLGREGQQIVLNCGLVPETQPVRIIQLK
jgi:phosphate transport system substrate-binding protein